MTTSSPALCLACQRKIDPGNTCTSFPEGIPDDILLGGADHRVSRHGEQPFLLDPAKMAEFEDFQHFAPGGDSYGPATT
jgi:hypothetical protein